MTENRTKLLTEDAGRTTYASPLLSLAANTQRLLSILTRGVEDATALFIGDSTGNETGEWIYQTVQGIAARFHAYTVLYHLWDDATSAYGAPVTVQTGTGSQTLAVYNMSVAGKDTLYPIDAERFEPGVNAIQPDLTWISMGHNEVSGSNPAFAQVAWRSGYLALTEAVASACPMSGIVCVAQPPSLKDDYQARRARIYQQIAAQRGYGFLDVHQAFVDTGDVAALIDSGLIHPNSTGSALWATKALATLVYTADAPARTQPGSSFNEGAEELLPGGDFSVFTGALPDGFTTSGLVTASKDTTNYESTNGYALKLDSTAANAYLRKDFNHKKVQGRWVTVTARVWVNSGSAAARLALVESTGTTALSTGGYGAGFRTLVLSKKLNPASTYTRFYLYVDTSGAGSITVDWLSAVPGSLPRRGVSGVAGPAGPAGPAAGDLGHVGTLGSHPTSSYLGASVAPAAAPAAYAVSFRPTIDITVSKLDWITGAVSAGNYDVGLYDDAGNRLWSKGSTAWPAVSTPITETVSPSVVLTAGTRYWFFLACDASTSTFRGLSQSVAGQGRLSDGSAWGHFFNGVFPLGATHLPSSGTTATRIPYALMRSD